MWMYGWARSVAWEPRSVCAFQSQVIAQEARFGLWLCSCVNLTESLTLNLPDKLSFVRTYNELSSTWPDTNQILNKCSFLSLPADHIRKPFIFHNLKDFLPTKTDDKIISEFSHEKMMYPYSHCALNSQICMSRRNNRNHVSNLLI